VSEEEEEEERLWEKIESRRHILTRTVNPAKLTPYLRQCKVIDVHDEDEVLNSHKYASRINRTGRLMDILRTRGKRGCEAFLESLEFYYPEHYTRLTGREPTQRCSMILDEEGPEGLTQFLMLEVKKLRGHLKAQLVQDHRLHTKYSDLEEEKRQLELKVEELGVFKERYSKMKEECDLYNQELQKLKDENYSLAMRYAQACEEKTMAIMRSRDLQLEIDQLRCKITSVEEEFKLVRSHSIKLKRDMEKLPRRESLTELQLDNERLKTTIQELQSRLQVGKMGLPENERVYLDILDHDRKEALEDRQELCEKIHSLQKETQQAEELRDMYLQEKEKLELRCQTLKKDCEMYKQRMNTILSQLEEIEKERDQAIKNRDAVQTQFAQGLLDKDRYRRQIRGLEERNDELELQLTKEKAENATLRAKAQRSEGRWICDKYHPRNVTTKLYCLFCSYFLLMLRYHGCFQTSTPLILEIAAPNYFLSDLGRPKLQLLQLLCSGGQVWQPVGLQWHRVRRGKGETSQMGSITGSEEALSPMVSNGEEMGCEREINRFSIFPFPPGTGSILRRLKEDYSPDLPRRTDRQREAGGERDRMRERLTDGERETERKGYRQTEGRRETDEHRENLKKKKKKLLSCFSEPVELHLLGKPILIQQAKPSCLGSGVHIIGGNQTGVFVQSVQPGSDAERAGLREGCQLLQMEEFLQKEGSISLEHCTKEVVHLSLQWWSNPSALKFQPNMEAYRKLQRDLREGTVASGDSFYIRSNLNILGHLMQHSLQVTCDEVLHVLDTMHRGHYEWRCTRVDPYTMADLEAGTIPNWNRKKKVVYLSVCLLLSFSRESWLQSASLPLFSERRIGCPTASFSTSSPPRKSPQHNHAPVFGCLLHQRASLFYSLSRLSEHWFLLARRGGQVKHSVWLVPEEGDSMEPQSHDGDDNILPYCLVQPVTTPNQRPVILTPGRLAKALIQKILQLPSSDGSCFEDCPTATHTHIEILEKKGVASSEMLVVRNVDCSRVECIQFKTIKASITQNKHGFLQLGLHSVKELVQREIYPIVIHIKLTEKSLKKLR
uniref:Caspase recruitment domain family member 10 n=1 Tax=Latimeria chalumnae TaxID=7897 RepID=H3A3N9_LATCH